jgi:ABC-type uncharacterized transport system ATPase subunit
VDLAGAVSNRRGKRREKMLEVVNLTKYYGKLKANDSLNFTVGNGEIAVLCGPKRGREIHGYKMYHGPSAFSG